MEQILSAVIAIVAGVGALAIYFAGSNWLLGRLLPDQIDEQRSGQSGTQGNFSLPDVLTIVLGVLLLIFFYTLPWLSFSPSQEQVNSLSEGGVTLPADMSISLTGAGIMAVDSATLSSVRTVDSPLLTDEILASINIDREAFGYLLQTDTINDAQLSIGRAQGINTVFPFAAVVVILIGIWGVFDRYRQRAVALAGAHLALFFFIYFVLLNFQLLQEGRSLLDVGQLGLWLSLAATIVLFGQVFIPRPAIKDYNRAISLREAVRPWLFVGPALVILGMYLVYPAIQTFFLAFGDADGNIAVTRTVYPPAAQRVTLNFNATINEQRLEVVQTQLAETFPTLAEIDLASLPEFESVRDAVEYFLDQAPEAPAPADFGIALDADYDAELVLGVRDQLAQDYPIIGRIEQESLSRFTTNGDAVSFLVNQASSSYTDRFDLFRNFEWAFSSGDFWNSIRNNILWLLVPFLSTVFGLLVAVLADRVRWGTIAKSLIFLPMAISFVGASVIWKFVYDANIGNPTPPQIGILNAIVVGLGGQPQDWIALEPWNNFFLMVILIWIETGFAMVLLGAALRGVPEETLEAARIDGADEVQIFFSIMLPQIMSTILVVLTTITIVVLKVFDIVLAMTNGQNDTQVLANLMYNQAFRAFDDGRGSVVAVILMLAVVPIMVWNIRQFQEEERMR